MTNPTNVRHTALASSWGKAGLASPARRLAVATLAVLSLAAGGCKGKDAQTAMDLETARERVAQMLSREHPPMPTHELTLLDGLATGTVESKVPPRVECTNQDGVRSCGIDLDMGVDQDGDPAGIACFVSTELIPFGVGVHKAIGGAQLVAPPAFVAKKTGQGISNHFEADTIAEDEANLYIGSVKIATLYSKGYMATCLDPMAGGKQTFKRVVEAFLSSLKFQDNPSERFIFGLGYVLRKGDQSIGFRYSYLLDSADEGVTQVGTSFSLEIAGKEWKTLDTGMNVERNEAGETSKYQLAVWSHGMGPLVLTAKPTEEGKFRIKREINGSIDTLTLTPKAKLSTEIAVSPMMLQLATGSQPTLNYAFPGLDEDGDPTLAYSVLKAHKPGIVLEQTQVHAELGEESAAPQHELHVDESGVVTKQVDPDSVSELVYREGTFPPSMGKP